MARPSKLDSEYGYFCQCLTNAPTTVSLSGITATSSVLAKGRYRIISTTPCFLRQGGSTITAATTDNYLPENVVDYITVTASTDGYLAGITTGSTGTLYITKQIV